MLFWLFLIYSCQIDDKLLCRYIVCCAFVCFLCAVILVAHFLQSVSSGLVLGGELVYHRGRAEEGGILTLAGQYSSEILLLFVSPWPLFCLIQQQFSPFFSFCLWLRAGPNWVATLNAGKGGAHASYYHRANKQVQPINLDCINTLFASKQILYLCVGKIQVGVEFEASTRTQETTTSFGYQIELPEANMVFRGR